MRLKSTSAHKRYWTTRTIDWKTQYLDTWNHPHRGMLAQVLAQFHWYSLWEVGCGPGPNLMRLFKEGFKDRQLGGSDISPEAIELARSTFIGGKFRVESVEDILLSDNATDVTLSDATLIYIDPTKIKGVLKELVRITRNRIVLCEFHSHSFWKRWLLRLKTGYNAYNYQQLLEEAGCYDIQFYKLPPEAWPGCKPGDGWHDFGYIITAKV